MPADPKPRPRIEDPDLLAQLHRLWRECVLCGMDGRERKLSLHHVHKHPRDDIEGNLVMLCGDGVSGCHGKYEAAHLPTRRLLMRHLLRARPDTMAYLRLKLGGDDRRDAWMERQMRSKA